MNWCQRTGHKVTLVLYRRLEMFIGSMQPIQYSSTTEVIGEPGVQKDVRVFP